MEPDSLWDLMRRVAKMVPDQCDHPARIPSVPKTEDADAELIALAADYAAVNAEIRRLEADPADDPEIDYEPLDARRYAAREKAAEQSAATPAGLSTKASIYLGEIDLMFGGEDVIPRDCDTTDFLADSIARDVLGLAGIEVAAPRDAVEDTSSPTVSAVRTYLDGPAAGLTVMAARIDATMGDGLKTLATGLVAALERAQPGAALLLPGSAWQIRSSESRTSAEADAVALGTNRPDAMGLYLARELMRIDARVHVLNECPDAEQAGMDDVQTRQYVLLDTLTDAPAKTAAGWRAKGEVLKAMIDADVLSLDPEHKLALSLAGDLVAGIRAQQ